MGCLKYCVSNKSLTLRHLAKSPWILSPHEIELRWHGKNESAQVGEGEVEEVDVGGRPHVLILDDHQAGGKVAQHTQD